MSIEAMKQMIKALEDTSASRYISRNSAIKAGLKAIAETEKQVAFKIYKPTPPRGAIPNVRDAELPWVYDQDPSSGNVASMWVTPVHPHPQPKREPLTDEQVEKIIKANMSLQMNLAGIRQDFEAAYGNKENA